VIIVDEFTAARCRDAAGSDGLHQAVEAKEGVKVQQIRRHATITVQNYFRQYEKLLGYDRYRDDRAEEFHMIYKLDVVPIPPTSGWSARPPGRDLQRPRIEVRGRHR